MKPQQKHLEIMINSLILFTNKKSKKLEIKYNKQRLKNEKLRNGPSVKLQAPSSKRQATSGKP